MACRPGYRCMMACSTQVTNFIYRQLQSCSKRGRGLLTERPGAHLFRHDILVGEVSRHTPHKFYLLLRVEASNGSLEDGAQGDLVHLDESVIVHVGEEAHDELTVHAVRHATVPGNGVAEVLDLEGALEARSKEAAEWGDERSKRREHERVDLHGGKGEGKAGGGRQEEELRQLVRAREENGIRLALQASKDIGAEVLLRVSTMEGEDEQR